jgi:hypothetical protein
MALELELTGRKRRTRWFSQMLDLCLNRWYNILLSTKLRLPLEFINRISSLKALKPEIHQNYIKNIVKLGLSH